MCTQPIVAKKGEEEEQDVLSDVHDEGDEEEMEEEIEKKMKEVQLMEDEVKQLEEKAAKAPASVKSDGGARKKERKSHPKPPKGEGSPPSLRFLSF